MEWDGQREDMRPEKAGDTFTAGSALLMRVEHRWTDDLRWEGKNPSWFLAVILSGKLNGKGPGTLVTATTTNIRSRINGWKVVPK